MRRKVAIIGAGIAGLSAGCYLQMNGYDTEIFELHNLPGGLCTAWQRKGFTIDGCIHWLVGSSPSHSFYQFWNELVDMRSLQFIEYDEYLRVEDRQGTCIRVFTDLDKLEREFLEKAPEDKELITEFIRTVRKFLRFDLPSDKAPETFHLFDGIKMGFQLLPYLGELRKWNKISMREYAQRCKNPLLKHTFERMFWPDVCMLFILIALAFMHRKSAGYPLGASLNFVQRIESRYTQLGGKIHYRSKVRKILTEDDRACGIELENGATHRADIVISAADGHASIFEMLDGKYLDTQIRDYYEHYDIFPSYLQVSLGIARSFEHEPHALTFPLERTLFVDASSQWENIGVRIFNFDPTLAPEGKTLVTVMLPTTNYAYWEQLRQENSEKYQTEKERIAHEIIEALETRFGNIRDHVDMIDVSTPATVIRYTNNWKGTFEGWVLSPKMGFRRMKKTLPGLKNFYMAGQWVEPGGGLPTALLSGRNVTQLICKEDKKHFATTQA